MLRRTADSLYWMERYMERMDAMIRSIKTNYVLSFDAGIEGKNSWNPLLNTFTHSEFSKNKELEFDMIDSITFMIIDPINENSLANIIAKARENARGAQDHITKEVWEQVNKLYHLFNQNDFENKIKNNTIDVLDQLTEFTTIYQGVTFNTMPRGNGWDFMNLGKFIERSLITVDLSNQYFECIYHENQEDKDILYWRNLLLSLSGYELHLKTYRTQNHNKNTIDQIILNGNFTRSLSYSIKKVKNYLDKILQNNRPEAKEIISRFAGRIHSQIEFTDPNLLNGQTLSFFLSDIKSKIIQLHNQLDHTFFSY